jgi:hypothetical protein
MLARGAAISDIDDMLETTLNAPKRVRPPRPETLQRQIAQLKAENHQLTRRVAATAPVPHVAQLKRQPLPGSNNAVASSSSSTTNRRRNSIGGPAVVTAASAPHNTSASTTTTPPMSSAVTIAQQLEVARCEIDTHKNVIAAHQQMLVDTQAQLRLLRTYDHFPSLSSIVYDRIALIPFSIGML